MIKLKTNQGFTLFVAIMVTSTLLIVSMGIIALAYRENIITSAARESQFAFYAADTGADCAIYWDVVGTSNGLDPYPVSAFTNLKSDGTGWTANFDCNHDSANPANRFTIGHVHANGFSTSTTFAIKFLPDAYCAEVTVVKSDSGQTKIESLGFNTGAIGNPSKTSCGNPATGHRVQRAVRVTY